MKELKDAIEKSSDQEALSAKKQVIDRMQQITNKLNKLNTDPLQSATMEFVPSKESHFHNLVNFIPKLILVPVRYLIFQITSL